MPSFLRSTKPVTPVPPRGVRCNNPGDIVSSQVEWKGEVHPSRDPRFATFIDMPHGIRAAAILMQGYQRNKGLTTIGALCQRYAPPVENDTNEYAETVAAKCGVHPVDQFLVYDDPRKMALLLRGIFVAEGTSRWVTPEDLIDGIKLAF